MRPSFGLPPEEVCFGVSPRKAANSHGPAKLDASLMVAAIAEAMIGPKPGMLVSRRAVSSRCASFAMVVLKPRNRVVEISQLHHQRRQHLAHFKRDCLVAGLHEWLSALREVHVSNWIEWRTSEAQ
jgi:hypothetical protein